ncbi:coatomer complex beta [Cryptosporidium xiaoi]|uniref:Beta'-coat protein n=1 Tax=Cryptosporidium xiaoi TaxID=659607 RepID=A0AAV9XYQ5_9CRYT
MPLRLDIKKKLQTSSERVKSIDFHSTEPWILSGLYSGTITVYDYETQSLVKSLEVSEYPIRCAVFVCRKQWIITCGDDLQVRVYSYNTMKKVTSFEAHNDFIRHMIVHSKLPLLLTCSDDMTIKIWDWERDWIKAQTYQGNSHYVMMIQWNPKDNYVFASVSLDRTIRIWGIPSNICSITNSTVNTPNYTLSGHDGGINCLAYSPSAEKPYIATGSDDKTVRVWDYQTKQCIQVLSGHTKAVRSILYHPQLPLILSCSEDGTIKIWHSTTYRLECTLNYMLDRSWCLAVNEYNILGIGYDEGTVVLKLGSEQPISTLNGSKIIIAKGTEIYQANLRALYKNSQCSISTNNTNEWEFEYEDGERIVLPFKEIGCSEIYPQDIRFHPNGRFISVCGDGEFVVYTTQALRSKCFGKAVEMVWSIDGQFFSTRESGGRIVVYHNFKESCSFFPSYFVDEIFGGQLLGVKSNDFVCFYDWLDCKLIRRIDVSSSLCNVYWDEQGNYVCLSCSDMFYILKYNKDEVDDHLNSVNSSNLNDGIEIAFEFVSEINDKVESGIWISNCFIYVTSQLRLQIWMNGFIDSIAYLPEKSVYHILGYIKEIQRIVLMNREFNCISYYLNINYIEYQSCIIRKDFETAENVYWNRIPANLHTKIAKFLEIQGYKEKALTITDDLDQKFDLAIDLGKFELCVSILHEIYRKDREQSYSGDNLSTTSSVSTNGGDEIDDSYFDDISPVNRKRWKVLGDIALEKGMFSLAISCYKQVHDLDSLLLIYSSIGDLDGLRYIANIAVYKKQWNTALLCHNILNDKDSCINDLINSEMIPYAALFARCYSPSNVNLVVEKWRELNEGKNSEILATPRDNKELFPYFDEAINLEDVIYSNEYKNNTVHSWDKLNKAINSDLLEDFKLKGPNYIKNVIWDCEGEFKINDNADKYHNESKFEDETGNGNSNNINNLSNIIHENEEQKKVFESNLRVTENKCELLTEHELEFNNEDEMSSRSNYHSPSLSPSPSPSSNRNNKNNDEQTNSNIKHGGNHSHKHNNHHSRRRGGNSNVKDDCINNNNTNTNYNKHKNRKNRKSTRGGGQNSNRDNNDN